MAKKAMINTIPFALLVCFWLTLHANALSPVLVVPEGLPLLGYEVLPSGALKVEKAEIRDGGIYICIAQNNAGTALGQVKLAVQGRWT